MDSFPNTDPIGSIIRLVYSSSDGVTKQLLEEGLEAEWSSIEGFVKKLITEKLLYYDGKSQTFCCMATAMDQLRQLTRDFELELVQKRSEREQYKALPRLKAMENLVGMVFHARNSLSSSDENTD